MDHVPEIAKDNAKSDAGDGEVRFVQDAGRAPSIKHGIGVLALRTMDRAVPRHAA